MIIKIVGEEVVLSSNSNIDKARNVRIYNDNGSDVVISRNYSNGVLIGNTTMQANSVMIFEKGYTDELGSSANVLATPVAYTIS